MTQTTMYTCKDIIIETFQDAHSACLERRWEDRPIKAAHCPFMMEHISPFFRVSSLWKSHGNREKSWKNGNISREIMEKSWNSIPEFGWKP